MERFVRGDVVAVPFPLFDLSSTKKRPAVVVAVTKRGAILCPITSKHLDNVEILSLTKEDFQQGKLKMNSWVLPVWLVTVVYSKILYKIGSLKSTKVIEIMKLLSPFFSS